MANEGRHITVDEYVIAVGSSPCRVKQETIKLVFSAPPLSRKH
jgi:hypothetical protein